MNLIRLVFGVLLLSLCVFGLPEGCLVFASHTAAPPLPSLTRTRAAGSPLSGIESLPAGDLGAGSVQFHPSSLQVLEKSLHELEGL